MRDKVTRQCPQTSTFEEKGEPKQIRTETTEEADFSIRTPLSKQCALTIRLSTIPSLSLQPSRRSCQSTLYNERERERERVRARLCVCVCVRARVHACKCVCGMFDRRCV